jgi:CHC2 zinc finger
VNLEKRAFHCFGCGAKGNVLDFVARMENAPLTAAAAKLAEICAIPLSEVSREQEESKSARTCAAQPHRKPHEELAKAREQGVLPNPSERVKEEPEPKREEPARPEPEALAEGTLARLKELELENRDLMITTRAKDMFIEQLQKDRESFVHER